MSGRRALREGREGRVASESDRDSEPDVAATEIRCQEKTRGGVCYEVILAQPEATATPPKRPASPPSKDKLSAQDIEDKLKAAEERRLTLEANKMAALAAKMHKIEEASRKKDEQTSQFIAQTKEALDQKMVEHEGKREAYITDLKTKMKDHIDSVEKTRLSLEQQTEEVRQAICEKLKVAEAQRDENIKRMLERLREHVSRTKLPRNYISFPFARFFFPFCTLFVAPFAQEEQVGRVRNSNAERFKQLDQDIQDKLVQAQTRREQMEKEQLEKLRNHVRTTLLFYLIFSSTHTHPALCPTEHLYD